MPEGAAWFPGGETPRYFESPDIIVAAHHLQEVWPALLEVERLVGTGLTAAGYIAYEAAAAFDPAMRTHAPLPEPLLWFGLYRHATASSPLHSKPAAPLSWKAQLSEEEHASAVNRIREWIAAGDSYQVNFTFPLRADWDADTLGHFAAMRSAQRTPYAAAINTGINEILSASPELFFRLDGDCLSTRPMKGTRPRGRFPAEDNRIAQTLLESSKDQAENVMITDLLRNDLGRVARNGSVSVPALFNLERYSTVWQLTSTITAETDATVPAIFRALFPCGSVTGAPKIRAMQIITELEHAPRGVYCGAIGWWAPGRQASFSVGIRTVSVSRAERIATYHTGSGITWDSTAGEEYRECLHKAAVLEESASPFELLETLLLDGEYQLLQRHLDRMEASADYFDFTFSRAEAIQLLDSVRTQSKGPLRVRLLCAPSGKFRVESLPLTPVPNPLRVALWEGRVNSSDRFLFHKTTRRRVYDQARASRTDCDDVLLLNENDQLTESCFGNLVLRLSGIDYTPPVECGLLQGCERAEAIDAGRIVERVLGLEDLKRAESISIINSVRGRMPARLID